MDDFQVKVMLFEIAKTTITNPCIKSSIKEFSIRYYCSVIKVHFILRPFLLQEKESKYQLRLENCRLRDVEAGLLSKRHYFALFNPDAK